MVYLFIVPPPPYKTRVSGRLQGGHKKVVFEAFSGVINRTTFDYRFLRNWLQTHIHVYEFTLQIHPKMSKSK